jgi:pimeloyl-ACP methyl ester carboxylesterase
MSPPLAAYLRGSAGATGRPIVFLHGLTFDHRMWAPVVAALPQGSRALSLDLPGHGASAPLPSHDAESVAEAVHETVAATGLEAPVVVGHSLAAGVALAYALRYPAAGVVAVDAAFAGSARALHALAGPLRNGGFDGVWPRFRQSMHAERLPRGMRALLAAGDDVSPELVLGYWAEVLDSSPQAWAARTDEWLARLRASGVPVLAIYSADRDPDELAWLPARVPAARVETWPAPHHFPHLADPIRFASTVAGLAAAPPAGALR